MTFTQLQQQGCKGGEGVHWGVVFKWCINSFGCDFKHIIFNIGTVGVGKGLSLDTLVNMVR